MLNDLNISKEWLLRMAEKEGNGIISVGGLVCQILKGERESMPDPTTYYPTTTFDASPATLPREGEGQREDWASVARRYQNALNEQGKRLVEIHRKLSDREVELIALRAELAKRDETIRGLDSTRIDQEYKINRIKGEADDARDVANKLTDEKTELRKENAALRAELAKREESLAEEVEVTSILRNERDELRTALDDQLREWIELNNRKWSESRDTTTSLRSQLARAEAIEEAAIEAKAWLSTNGAGCERRPYEVIRKLTDALASPSLGPGAAESIGDAFGEDASDEEEASFAALPTVTDVVASHDAEMAGATDRLLKLAAEARLAILERIAKEAKAYREAEGCDAIKPGRRLDIALADLDELEAQS